MTPIAVLAAVVVGGIAFIPGVRRANDPRDVSWLDAWLKAIVIFAFVCLFVVFLPSYVMQHSQVTKLDPLAQDLLGTGVWSGGFLAVLGLLFYFHGRGRV